VTRAAAVAAAIVLAIALGPLSAAAGAGVVLDRIVAVVNSEAVTWSELYREMEFELSRQMKALSAEEKRAAFKASESAILERMIDLKLQLQEAEKQGITVSDDDIRNAIEGIKGKYSMDDEAFSAALRAEGFTLGQYREKLREQVAITRLVDREVRNRIVVTDQEVADYVKVNGARFRLRQIFFRAREGAGDEVARRISEVQARLGAGEDFASVARELSEGPMAADGGDLGMVDREHLAPEFQKALEGMKSGDVSEPFRTARGVHIIKLEGSSDPRDAMLQERFEAAYRSWLKGLRERSFIDVRL